MEVRYRIDKNWWQFIGTPQELEQLAKGEELRGKYLEIFVSIGKDNREKSLLKMFQGDESNLLRINEEVEPRIFELSPQIIEEARKSNSKRSQRNVG